MQIYVSGKDLETFMQHKPPEFETATAWMTDILRKKAQIIRASQTVEGIPKVPDYPHPGPQ